jgi:hypothetical protein
MPAAWSELSSSDGAHARTSGGSAGAGVSTVLWGTNEDTRLLLRGLLRLHRCPVLHEVGTWEELTTIPSLPGPTVLIVDAESETAAWEERLPEALAAHPELRALVILPAAGQALESRARTAGAATVVLRPFAIRDFVRAVGTAAEAPPAARLTPHPENRSPHPQP